MGGLLDEEEKLEELSVAGFGNDKRCGVGT